MKRRHEENTGQAEQKQPELFPELQAGRAKSGEHLLRKDAVFGRKVTMNLSYENIILLFIAFIMLLVLFFSMGVEKGKRINAARAADKNTAEDVLQIARPEETVIAKESGALDKKTVEAPVKPYTIQVSAFRKAEKAGKEIESLKHKGYDAFLIPSQEWLQVCVGRYTNKEESRKDFEELEKEYPTCFFRKMEQ